MNKKITAFLILFIVLDTCYTFYQHYYLPHDGDMAAIIMPASWYSEVLQDPFGLEVVTEGKRYSGTNRFFAHWSLSAYFKTVPLVLQKVTDPLTSSYLAAALARTGMQLLLVWIIAAYITGTGKWWKPTFILAAALVIPMFQMDGLFVRMGIIGNAITYSFFYALSVATVLLFFLPFYRAYVLKQTNIFSIPQLVLLLVLTFIIPFQGPLNFGLILLTVPGALLYFWLKNMKDTGSAQASIISNIATSIARIPKPVLFFFSLILLLSLYSYYISLANTENDNSSALPLAARYPYLLTGLNQQLFYGEGMAYGPAYSILFLIILVNAIILWKNHPNGKQTMHILKWSIIFSVIYILILPLGGYRSYRPYIIVSNTFLPVTLLIIFAFGYTTWQILSTLKFRFKPFYALLIGIVILIFSTAERPNSVGYDCEREGIQQLAASKDKFVTLDTWCGIMSWGPVTNPYFSEVSGKLLHYWNVLAEDKTFVTRKEN